MPAKVKAGADYSATLNLPRTDFPMKADLPRREPEQLKLWQGLGLYDSLQKRQAGRKRRFTLHDGPPYANGRIHIGHALNKVLKDMAVKSRSLMGFATPYVPGWDCHGLPIETALLKELKISKSGVTDIPAFRKQAEAFAERFIGLQRAEFERLGVLGDWQRPYKTMSREYEALVLRAFRLLLKGGYVYRGLKPVLWCIACETALAEAEVEYKDKSSPAVHVAFPIRSAAVAELQGAEVVVWTTTPWTLPANRAVAFHPLLSYTLIEASRSDWPAPRRFLVAARRMEDFLAAIGAQEPKALQSWDGAMLAAAAVEQSQRCFVYDRPFGGTGVGVLADYVTAEDGTGVVHTAPGHGADDFHTGQRYGLEIACPVDSAGRFTAQAGAALSGKPILSEGNPQIIAMLAERGWLLKKADIQHSYPHCWRCKNPVVFRATEQWFLNVGHEGLRERLIAAINAVEWIPAEGQRRIAAMVQNRPDWCLSRQRVWGTPIPVLFCVSCRKPVIADAVLSAIEREVANSGDGFWFANWGEDISRERWPFLPDVKCSCGGARFQRERDILDVWMDSGASWLAVLAPLGQAPCELYLEGSDQHRGWFQSSLVLSVALAQQAPYRSVLTHGFVLDEKGHAMHKSAGNVVAPQEVIGRLGADVLRLWVALADYRDDVRLGGKLLDGPSDGYRRLRNTVRYLLGNTCDFTPAGDAVAAKDLPELERYMLHRLGRLQVEMLGDYERYEFRAAARRLIDFCSFDLSSFYCDVLKDRLYTFPKAHPARRAAQTVLAEALRRLLLLASPIVSFTAEEGWQHGPRRWGYGESVFLAELPGTAGFEDNTLAARWQRVLEVRAVAQKAIEQARAEKRLGSSLQSRAVLSGPAWLAEFAQWPEVLLVSEVEVRQAAGTSVIVEPAPGAKCARCWRYQRDVGSAKPELCGRCALHLAGA